MKNLGAILLAAITLGVFYFVVYGEGIGKETEQGNPIELDSNIKSLNLRLESSDTTIIPVEQDFIEVKIDGKGALYVKGNKKELIIEVRRKWYERFGLNAKSNVTVNVPKDFQEKLSVSIGSGNLTFDGGRMELEELSLNLSSGDMELDNITAKTLKHNGSSGDLHAKKVITKEAELNISSGDVRLEDFEGALSGDVSSGELKVTISQLLGDIDLDVSSGDVQLTLPDNADFTLNGKYSSGNIASNKILKFEDSENGVIKGVSGTGKYEIKLSVSSGSVHLN
ncbi:DUF4097 family beta strand repeat-containing protein [Mangrovibacillus cuniculi]|uniref:DUF4097 domain-containing protein n=1 Tax=Mangrovibacillus cuniculi TaxID=2593652 RepID=A0A7S8CC18_9BACI|nr:DUF4097 family beta strand repeat-containing protein [Mangrovibacillus cuniculi]QPC47219.1 DUF4097 domain-containing protein [Mangrovibacillus cuniculi]